MRITRLPLDLLDPDPTQPRTAMIAADLDALVESIRVHGLLLPLRVRPVNVARRHVILSGHRRHAALVKIGAVTADCIVADGPLDEGAILAEGLIENLLREDLSPIDEGEGFRRYMALRGVTAAQAAHELHVPPTRISRSLPLLDLPVPLREAIHAGRIPKDTAYYLSRLEGEDRDRLFARALAGDLSRDEAARCVKAVRHQPAASAAPARVTCKLPAGRSVTVSGTAIDLDTLIGSLEEVLLHARKARTQNWDVSTLAKVFKDRAVTGGVA